MENKPSLRSFFSKGFLPKKQNSFVWFNAIFLLILLANGEVTALTIVIAYFLETIIVGVVYVFKFHSIISSDNAKPENKGGSAGNYGLIVFFLFHYCFFVAIQLIFVFAFLEISEEGIKEAFNLIENLAYVLSLEGMNYVLISIAIYNFADYFLNFILPKTYETANLNKTFSEPYIRIFIQQFAVILGGFFMFLSNGVLAVAILLILIRSLIELYFIENPVNNFLNDFKAPPFSEKI